MPLSEAEYNGCDLEITAYLVDREMDRSSTDELPAQDNGMEDGVIVDNKAHRAFHYDDRRHLPYD